MAAMAAMAAGTVGAAAAEVNKYMGKTENALQFYCNHNGRKIRMTLSKNILLYHFALALHMARNSLESGKMIHILHHIQ